MAPETVPVLRCESRLPRAEPRWGWIAAAVVLLASTVDALWLVPAQRRAAQVIPVRVECVAPAAVSPPEAPSPAAGKRVTDIYLLEAPPRR